MVRGKMIELGALLVITVLIFITISFSIVNKNFLNPLMFFIGPLTVSYYLFYFIFRPIHIISPLTVEMFTAATITFTISFLTSNKVNRLLRLKFGVLKKSKNIKSNRIFIYAGIIFGLISFVYAIYYFKNLGNSGSSGNAVREAYIDNVDTSPFVIKYGKYFLLFGTSILWYEYLNNVRKINKYGIYLLISCSLANSFLTLSRTDLMITIIPFAIIFAKSQKGSSVNVGMKNMYSKMKTFILVTASIGLIAMIGSLRSMTKATSLFSPNSYIAQYIGYPLVAFNKWILPRPGTGNGIQSLEPLNKISSALGVGSKNELSFAPIGQFNVYGFMKEPYLDFGFLGIIIYMIVIGFFCGWIYQKSLQKNEYYIIFYSFYMYATFMAFFSWSFFMITYVYLFVYLLTVGSVNTSMEISKNNKLRV